MSAPATETTRADYAGALLRYRIMAFTTGTVLVLATIALILQDVVHLDHIDGPTAVLWIAHGYLFLLYVAATFMLGLKRRWHPVRIVVVMAAGTIPTMSFVAEHYVTRDVRASTDRPAD